MTRYAKFLTPLGAVLATAEGGFVTSVNFIAANQFLREQPGNPYERVLVLQDDYNLSAYSPILSGKPVTEGSARRARSSSAAKRVSLSAGTGSVVFLGGSAAAML